MRPPLRHKRERGSVTVLAVFLLPIMLLMCIMLANIGQAIFEKIRLQNTVDAAALAAATVQSVGLNEIADLSFEMDLEYFKCLEILLTAPVWYSLSDGMAAVSYFQKVFNNLRTYQDRANTYYAQKALSIAQRVKQDNLPKATLTSINPNDSRLANFSAPETRSVFFLWRICSCCPCGLHCKCECCPFWMSKKWMDAVAGRPQYRDHHDGRVPMPYYGIILPYFSSVSTKRSKLSTPTTYSAFKITQPARNFILASGVFGRMESLEAYAAAKPAGGNVYSGVPDYKPIMVQLRSLAPPPRLPDLARFEH